MRRPCAVYLDRAQSAARRLQVDGRLLRGDVMQQPEKLVAFVNIPRVAIIVWRRHGMLDRALLAQMG